MTPFEPPRVTASPASALAVRCARCESGEPGEPCMDCGWYYDEPCGCLCHEHNRSCPGVVSHPLDTYDELVCSACTWRVFATRQRERTHAY